MKGKKIAATGYEGRELNQLSSLVYAKQAKPKKKYQRKIIL